MAQTEQTKKNKTKKTSSPGKSGKNNRTTGTRSGKTSRKKRNKSKGSSTTAVTIVAVILILVGIGLVVSPSVRHWFSFGKEARIYGLDLSRYQEEVSWEELGLYYDEKRDTISFEETKTLLPASFIFLKATQGRAFDRTYSNKKKEAQKHGYRTGAYHILVNDTNIMQQAFNFIHTAKLDTSNYPPILDIESDMVGRPHSEYRQKVLQWLSLVEKETGGKPLIYCSDKVRETVLNTTEFDNYHFWIARYDTTPPRSKDDWLFWQFTEKGRVKGIKGKVDVNIWKGTKDELEVWRRSCWRKDSRERERIELELDKVEL